MDNVNLKQREGTMNQFNGKRVFVTGGSSGIGLEAARQLASSGAHVAIFARNQQRLETARESIAAAGISKDQSFYSLSMDVSKNTDVDEKIQLAVSEFGTPDILIHSAGVGDAGYFEDASYETFDSVIRTNLYGTRNVTASLVPFMKEKGGHMVIVSALAGLVGPFGWSTYATSKFGQVGFCECIRPELKRYNINVSVFVPGEVETPLADYMLGISPPESKALAKTFDKMLRVLTPEKAAKELLKGIEKNKFLIFAGNMPKILYFVNKNLPGLSRTLMDITVSRAIKKKNT
jgi:3-dehydrosphinganine reductase